MRATTSPVPIRVRGALLLALACATLAGCEGAAIRVLVAGDLAVPDEADALSVTVRADGEVATSRYALEERADALRESLTLLPGERMRAAVDVEVDALKGARKVAAGQGRARFREGATQELVVTLSTADIEGDAGPPPNDAGPDDDAGRPDAGPSDAGRPDCLDEDGDGYGDGPDCLDYDCDDENPDVHPGAEELCNGIDDDCDFGVDEGCDCPLAASNVCGTLRGECRLGVQVCTSGTWTECDGATLPTLEVCNGKDDDCDGQRDEGCE